MSVDRNSWPLAVLLSLAAANFAVGTGALVVAGIVPNLSDGLGVSEAASGQLVTVYAIVYALAAPVAGIWASRHSERRILLAATTGLFAANVAAVFATSYTALVVARVAAGVFAAVVTPAAAALAARLVVPERTGAALGLVFGGVAISTVLGVPAGAYLGARFDWQSAFVFVSALSLLALFAQAATLPKAEGPIKRRRIADLVAVLKSAPLVAAVGVTALQMTAQFLPFTYIAVLLRDSFDATPGQVFAGLLTFGIASVVGNYFGGLLSDRLGPDRTIRVGLIALPFCLAGLANMTFGFRISLIALALWGAVGFGYNAPQQARLVRLAPENAATLLALNASAIYVGTTLGSALGGVVVIYAGAGMLAWTGVVVSITAFLLFAMSRRLS